MSVYQDSLKANSGYASAFSLGHIQMETRHRSGSQQQQKKEGHTWVTTLAPNLSFPRNG